MRRTPLSKTTYKSKPVTLIRFDESAALPRLSLFSSSSKDSSTEKTVFLSPGPVGFELQPVNKPPIYGCRVTRFVDGGPGSPGQARKSGIKPGDLVLKVEAEGTLMVGTTYDEIVDILQLSHTNRIITVQTTGERKGLMPADRESSTKEQSNEISLPSPPSVQSEKESFNETIEANMIHRSSFDDMLPSVSFQMESFALSQTSPIRNRTILLEAAKGPMIVPLGKETRNSPCIDSASKSMNSSFSSQDTTKSSNKSTPPRQSDTAQSLLLVEPGGAFEPYASQVSYETMISGVQSTRSENKNIESKQVKDSHFDETEQQMQPESSYVGYKNKGDIDLFEDSLARAGYEQRLQVARREHSRVERELKDLYKHTCERNENKIRELQVDRDVLQNALDEKKVERTFQTDTRIKELERQVAEAEKVKMRTQVEAREKMKANANKCARLIIAKENEWSQKFAELDNKINNLREESDSRLVELNMSRTMVTEMETRIRSSETEKEEVTIRLEEASCSIQKLKEFICRIKEGDEAKECVLEKTREKLNTVLQENDALVNEKETYESFKEESSVLTEKLAKSVQEKQKALLESQSIASKLNAENDDLMNQIAESTSDVEQLVQEKLRLEERLALTWKNIEKAKNDASRIHETLLEKQENGEYFTSSDIEEKDTIIRALESKVKSITSRSKEALIKSNKKAIILHIQLREVERKILESDLLNAKSTKERDDWHNTSIGLEKILANTKRQVAEMTKVYRTEMASLDELKARAEAESKAKEESDLQYEKSIESLSLMYESKKSELQSCEEKLDKIELVKNKALAVRDELKADLEGVINSKEDSDLQYQKSIESLSLQLESKKSELSSCEGRMAEMVSLNKKEKTMTTNLKTQLAAFGHAKDEAEALNQKLVLSISSELESKTKEFSEELNLAQTKGRKLEENIVLLREEKEHLVTKYEDRIEALLAKLEIEGQNLTLSKETQSKLRHKIESLATESKKEIQESQEKLEVLTNVLQSQCEEYSCLELRSEILEEDYNSMKLAQEKTMEEMDAIKQEKKEIEGNQEEAIMRLTTELQSKQSELETTKSDLTKSIKSLTLKNEEATVRFQEDMEELRMTIEALQLESESASTQYWESVQELTTELQEQNEKLERGELILKDMEENIDSRKIDIESSTVKMQELEHEIFEKGILVGNMTTKISSQIELLDCNQREMLEKDELISSLQSRISDLEKDSSDKLELQKLCDSLKKTVMNLETSKKKMSVEFCSEIFRFVKRLAVLDKTHSDVNDQRMKAMSIAMMQQKLYTEAKTRAKGLEKELQTTSSRVVQLESKLKHNLTLQNEREHQVGMELDEKSKQLEHQNVKTSALQAEVSALTRLTKHLKDSKEIEISELKESNGNLQSALSFQKESNTRSAENTYDAKIELKMLDKKYSSMISSKDEALLKSENNRTTIARSLLQANAVVTSLRVQLKEKDRYQIADELHQKAKEEIDSLKQTVSTLRGEFDEQNIHVDRLKQEAKSYEELSRQFKGDLEMTERKYQNEVVILQRQVLSIRGSLVSKYLRVQALQKDNFNLHEIGRTNEKVIEELQETNERRCREMEKMSEKITENEEQKDKKARLLKNIENLSTKLISVEETMKQNEILHRDSEESLKRSISKLRAEYVAKHLETNDLKKKVAVLCQEKKMIKKDTKELRITISNQQFELESTNSDLLEKQSFSADLIEKVSLIQNERRKYEEKMESLLQSKNEEMAHLSDQLEQTKSQTEILEGEKKALEENHVQEKREMESLLLESEAKVKEHYRTSHSLQNNLANEQKKVKEEESNRKSDAEKFSTLRRELSLRLEILEREKNAMAETISRQEGRLRSGEEKFNQEIALEISRLREKAGKLEAENFTKTASLAESNSNLESIRDRFRDLLSEKNDLEEMLRGENDARFAIQEKSRQDLIRHNERKDLVLQLQAETDKLRKTLLDNEESMSAMKRELQQWKDRPISIQKIVNSSSSDPPVLENDMSSQLSSVKDAFKIQAAMLEDVKLSESMLETLIKEVTNLATQSESEMLELSSVLGTADDLLLNPSSLLTSLDLAGLASPECYFKEVRSRLEDLAALAYTTSVELNNRQNQLKQWMSNRAESPVLPATPPCSKQLKRNLFDEKDINSDITPVITDGSKEVRDKVAGARLLSCILENNNKIKLASAFRKWTCAAGALNANSNASSHKETAVELAHELEITREKLMALKSHLKTGRAGKQKPRLRRILERLDGNATNQGDSLISKTYTSDMVPTNTDHTSTSRNDYSFEL